MDLPGYGFARVSDAEKLKWGELIEGYLKQSERLINVFVLVDIRREPNDDDIQMLKYLYAYSIPLTVIATKADKLSRAQRQKSIAVIASKLGLGINDVIVTSSETGQGKEEVFRRIDQLLENAKN